MSCVYLKTHNGYLDQSNLETALGVYFFESITEVDFTQRIL